jgi:hypothetical protein
VIVVAAVRTGVPEGTLFLSGAILPDGAVEMAVAVGPTPLPAVGAAEGGA